MNKNNKKYKKNLELEVNVKNKINNGIIKWNRSLRNA